jgi:GABA permease
VVIGDAGPAAVISFLIGGIITMLIMRMLAEMAVARPVVSSFYVYARQALGGRAGFATGWMYWYFFVIVVAVEAVPGGRILHLWLPMVPLWLLSLTLMVALTATNMVSASSYGEFEYWFSSIKVIAIALFLGMGVLWLTGLWPHSTPGLHNLVAHGGFTPQGWGAVLAAVVPCVAFYTGAEIVTIAAAESNEPKRAVSRAMRSIVVRLKMWLFPWLSYATIGLMVIVIAAMAVLPSTRSQFLMSGLTLLLILVSYQIRKLLRSSRTAVPGPSAEKPELAPGR